MTDEQFRELIRLHDEIEWLKGHIRDVEKCLRISKGYFSYHAHNQHRLDLDPVLFDKPFLETYLHKAKLRLLGLQNHFSKV